MAQYARPDADGTVEWTRYPSDTYHYEVVDEVTANDDTDYIQKSDSTGHDYLYLSDVTDPTVHTGHIMRARIKASGSGAKEKCRLQLYDTGGLVWDSLDFNVTRDAYNTHQWTLTEGEAGNITDYTTLYVRVYCAVIGSGEWMRCTWIEFEVPDAGQIELLEGSTAGQSGASGALKPTRGLAGSIGGTGGASAPMKATREVIGTADGQSGMSAPLKALREIIGSTAGQSGATGDLSVTAIVTLQGSTAGQSSVSGALKVVREIGGVIAGQSGADAALKVMRELAGIVEAQSAASAPLKLTMAIVGSADAVSSMVGDLTVAISAARTELELSMNISTTLALDGPLHRNHAMDLAITRTKEIEVEI